MGARKFLGPLQILSLWFFLVATNIALAAEDEQRNVLAIYATHDIPTWEESVSELVLRYLSESPSIAVTPEFLDLIDANARQQQLLAASLHLRYSEVEFDLVIAVSGAPNTFVHDWSSQFAPGVPIVHILPGQRVANEARDLTDRGLVLTAIETAYSKTLDLIPVIFPETEQLYLVSGAGESDRDYLRRLEMIVEGRELAQEVSYVIGTPVDEMITRFKAAPDNHLVLMLPYNLDNTGRATRTAEVIRELSPNIDIPIMAFSTISNLAGGVGGNSTTGPAYAQSAIEVIERMLNSNTIGGVPANTGTEYFFNGEQLDRFNIRRSLLPENSRIENDTPTIWRQYRGQVVAGGLVILAQLVLIGLLLGAIRRRRLAESELEKVHKMEALGSLAGGIAHDFNNILMSIVANAELAKMSAKKSADNTIKKLSEILTASDRAKNLISQILMFSRQANKTRLQKLNLRALVKESADQVRSFLPENCVLELHVAENVHSIEGDPTQLHQVIMNICVNAQHAIGGKQGQIEILIENIRLQHSRDFMQQEIPSGSYVALTIQDNGSGIDEAVLNHIFEPFYTTKPHGQGTGLGLALVYRIVKAHSGYINIESQPDEGATVTIYLPAVRGRLPGRTRSSSSALSHGHNETVLLVDDDEMVLDATSNMIKELGYSVDVFSSSVLALEAFAANSNKYQLVITDLSMPEMDGVRLITHIREIQPLQPIILCSGYSDGLKPMRFENVQVLNKPFSASEISQSITRLIKQITL